MTDADWVTDLVFDSVEIVIRVRTTDPAFGETIDRLTQHFPRTDAAPDHMFSVTHNGSEYSVSRGDHLYVDGKSRDMALMNLLAGINDATIVGHRFLVIHAGAVSRGGQVLTFPGSRGAGKSTLTAACLRTGFEYISDEALFIDTKRDQIVPYPKALWLRGDSRAAVQLKDDEFSTLVGGGFKSPVLANELGGEVASGELELSHVVLLERKGETARLEPIGQSEVAYQLLSHSFNRYQRPQEWFHAVSRTARRVEGWRLMFGDPLEAANYLDSYLGDI